MDNVAENVVVNAVFDADENIDVPDPVSSDVVVESNVLLDDVFSQVLISDSSSGEPSCPSLLDSQGFFEVCVADRLQEGVSVPNPPGPQSTPSVDIDMESQQAFDVQSPASSSPPDVSSDGRRGVSSDVSSSSSGRVSNRASVASSRRKPAPSPPIIDALNRRPTRPSLPVTKASGTTRSSSKNPPPPPPDVEFVS